VSAIVPISIRAWKCRSLLHRLLPERKNHKPTLNEIQPGLHPIEVLFDVEKLLRVKSEQPLSAAFERIVQAIGLYDHWVDMQGYFLEDSEQWSRHAVQSIVWNAAGCEKLAVMEENIVTAFNEVGGDNNNVITVTLNRAYRRARQGKYQDAIAVLLEPDVWRGLSLHDYSQWASQIWHIIVLRASRRGQLRQYNDLLKAMRPAGTFNPRDYFFGATASTTSIIRDPLYGIFGDAASRSGFRSSGATFESVMALRVPVSVWFLPNGDHLAGRRWP